MWQEILAFIGEYAFWLAGLALLAGVVIIVATTPLWNAVSTLLGGDTPGDGYQPTDHRQGGAGSGARNALRELERKHEELARMVWDLKDRQNRELGGRAPTTQQDFYAAIGDLEARVVALELWRRTLAVEGKRQGGVHTADRPQARRDVGENERVERAGVTTVAPATVAAIDYGTEDPMAELAVRETLRAWNDLLERGAAFEPELKSRIAGGFGAAVVRVAEGLLVVAIDGKRWRGEIYLPVRQETYGQAAPFYEFSDPDRDARIRRIDEPARQRAGSSEVHRGRAFTSRSS